MPTARGSPRLASSLRFYRPGGARGTRRLRGRRGERREERVGRARDGPRSDPVTGPAPLGSRSKNELAASGTSDPDPEPDPNGHRPVVPIGSERREGDRLGSSGETEQARGSLPKYP